MIKILKLLINVTVYQYIIIFNIILYLKINIIDLLIKKR